MTVRIIPDACDRYVNDSRWKDVSEAEQQFAFEIIQKIAGKEFAVLRTDWIKDQPYYNILVYPPFSIFDPLGQIQIVTRAFVPCDYAVIVRKGFWEAS
jgi:hypothetical protein